MDFKGKQVQKDLALRVQDYLTVYKHQELAQERLSYATEHRKISLPLRPPIPYSGFDFRYSYFMKLFILIYSNSAS